MEPPSQSPGPFPHPEPSPQHGWLQRLLGQWVVESASPPPPDDQGEWTERGEAIGDLWAVLDGEGQMPDGTHGRTIMTLGFDPVRNRLVGTFIASMMTHLWIYEGELDETGNVLTLRTEGPDLESERLAHYEDVIEIESDEHRTLRSRMQLPDGSWKEIMAVRYRRMESASS